MNIMLIGPQEQLTKISNNFVKNYDNNNNNNNNTYNSNYDDDVNI